ncbi:MAG TPA: acyl-CoA dehydrogenase family protein [Pseudonocardiaceae bacterium]|jgi:alkylation response protein AidB-like acyl-CoA dehydrogenase
MSESTVARAASFVDPLAEKFREEVSAWLAGVARPEWQQELLAEQAEDDRIAMRRDWDKIVEDGGFGGLSWPVEYGGRGLGPIEEYIFHVEAARYSAPDLLNCIGFDLAGPAILAAGTEAQQAKFLPRILRGQDLWCEGFSEPNAGSDMAATATVAEPCEGGYRVSGQKVWTSFAHLADWCYLLVKSSATAARHHNLSILLLDMTSPGIEVRPIKQITGESEFNELFLDNVFVSEENLLGAENEGWELATLAGFRHGRRPFDALRRYIQIRGAADRLGRCRAEQGLTGLSAEERETELLRWHISRVIEGLAAGRDVRGPSSTLRIVWGQLWQRISEAGLALGCPNHEAYWRHQYLHTRFGTIAGGTEQIQRNIISDRVLELPRK